MSKVKMKDIAALMGSHVEVRAVYRRGTRRRWEPSKTRPRVGFVTGFTYIAERVNVEYLGWEDGAVVTTIGKVPALLVRFWPNRKEVRVPMDSWSPVTDGRVPTWDSDHPMDEDVRAEYRAQANGQPRDERGRFVGARVEARR